jgi:hypothetical protein
MVTHNNYAIWLQQQICQQHETIYEYYSLNNDENMTSRRVASQARATTNYQEGLGRPQMDHTSAKQFGTSNTARGNTSITFSSITAKKQQKNMFNTNTTQTQAKQHYEQRESIVCKTTEIIRVLNIISQLIFKQHHN